ncbi:MAG TPA: SCO family protein [Candidatus Krumholzibacteria bacterium]|nr:SCO family protein [Candidatus Krumholzibacteria bacterium]
MRRIVVVCLALGLLPVMAAGGEPVDTRPELSLGRSAEYDYDPPVPGTYRLPVIELAGDGDVLTADGKRVHLRDVVAGQVSVLSFVYTRCADPRACPMATGALYEIQQISRKDATLAENLRLVTFSFDPEHDTPTVMKEYGEMLRPGGKGCEWMFLTTGSARELQPILEEYGQRVDRKRNANDPMGPFYHVVRVYLVDAQGRIRNIYSYGMLDPRMLLADVRTLILEAAAAGG